MRIAVLGATGPTGVELVKEAIARKYEVVALVRDPDKLRQSVADSPLLKAHKVDVGNVEELSTPMTGCDAVLSCLGTRTRGFFTPCTFYTDTISSVLEAVKRAHVSRLVCMTAWGTQYDPSLPFEIKWIWRRFFLRHLLPDMGAMEELIMEKGGDLDFTIVRPPRLLDEPKTGRKVLAGEGYWVAGGPHRMSRADVAIFMLDVISDNRWRKKCVAIDISPEK